MEVNCGLVYGQGESLEEAIADGACKALRQRRERIATAALQGLISPGWDARELTRMAVEYADALIAALDEETP